jgi:aspartate racemase
MGAMVTLQISSSTTAALKILSQEHGATAFMTMVASFMALLHGYTGQEDIVIGTVSDGRDHTETEGLLGYFLNTIVIRCAFSKELPFTELLKRVRSATLGALSHDAVPFELLAQKFAGKRDPSRGPLFQVLISIESPLTPLKEGWAFTQMDVDTGTAKFDLHLGLDDRAEGLIGRFIYNTDLFERETIELLKSRWLQLLDRIAAAPTQRVRDLTAAVWREAECEASPPNNTACDAERQKLLVDWNDLEQQLSYWRKQLARLPVSELPTDRPRPTAQSFRGAGHSISFSKSLTEGLRELSQREGATLYMTLLAAFQVLLARYTGQEDVVVGSPIAGRSEVETERLIGFFVNTLVLRTDLSGDPTFRELLRRVREVALGAYAHQDLPFEKLVEELQPERDLSQNPLFQVSFALQNAPASSFELAGLEVIPLPIESRTTHFDLEVDVGEKPGGLSCTFVYATDLFDAGTIVRMMGHYQTLLEGIVTGANRRVSELAILTEAERRQVVEEWNQTEREYPREKTVHELFEEQAKKTPQAEAVVFGRERLSYGQLNERANRLAGFLSKRGVGPEVLVGLCVERSLEMVVGLLGILKAGGAYVPLDPAYPKERLAFMLEDTGAPVVLTQESLSESLPEGQFERVRLDADWPEIARESAENPPSEATAENLAYVIYTSGSTGTPKGVSIRHRSVVRLVRETDYATFGPEEVFLQFAPISFDASTFEVWGPLLNGARLVVMPPGFLSLEELGAAIKRHKVSTLWLTAGLFHQMVETQIDGLRGVRQLLAGGDVLSVPHVERVLRELPDCRLINGYGPTENTTFTCCHTVRRDEPLGASVPIGRPIANTRVFILDDWRQPVPIGVPGELYIGGDGLARDYYRRPELTAQRFLPNPFGGEGEKRLYRTGDRARFRADGTIEFLGRFDDQVKIRGFRIEPGEIEAALSQHPGVREAVVVAREDDPGQKRLVAYVVGKEGMPGSSDLRGYLKQKLPEYMVPSAFLFLDALPLTPNGKVDRRALPAPEGRPELEEGYVAPRTPTEEVLSRIWAQVLGLDRVGVHDNFFDLGGHSLLAVRLFSQIEKSFDRHLPLAAIFQGPTVAQLASLLQDEGWTPSWSALVAINAGGSRPPFYCIHAIGGNVLTYADLSRHLGPDQPVYALQARGLDGKNPPHTRIEEMAAHYIKEIRELQPEGPYSMGGSSAGGVVAFEMAQQLVAAGQDVAVLALFDTWSPDSLSMVKDMSRLRRRATRFFERVDLHTGNLLAAEGLKGKLAYVATKSVRVRKRLALAGIGYWKKLKELTREIVDPLPPTLRKVENTSRNALDRYVPKAYPGRITLFRATKQPAAFNPDRELGWSRFAEGGVEVYDVPGHHGAIVYEPRIGILARQLAECLERARSAHLSPRGSARQTGAMRALSSGTKP